MTPFADGLEQQRIMLQRCDRCATVQLGRIRCDECLGRDLSWICGGETGAIHSYVIMHRAYQPDFADRVPYAAGIVELDEGPRIPVAFAIDRARLRAGLRVRASWTNPKAGPLCFVEERQ